MRWDCFELGPVLDDPPGGELRLAFDLVSRAPVCLRYYAGVQRLADDAAITPIAQPDSETPHLVRVLYLQRRGYEAWAERELCIGPPLQALLDRGAVSPSVAAGILAQVLEGLRALHQAGGAHGTLSPASVAFDLTTGRVRLVDLETAGLSSAVPVEPAGDLQAVGRICQALLQGGRTHTTPSASETPLWRWASRCLEGSREPLATAAEALAALTDLGLERVSGGLVACRTVDTAPRFGARAGRALEA